MEGLKKGAVFLDRDGTINEEVGYLNDLAKLSLIPGAAEAVRMINESGMKAVVVTNQSGVGRGYFTEDFVKAAHEKIQERLGEKGAHIDAFYFCPHMPPEGGAEGAKACLCRKPETGMFRQAAEDLNIDLGLSYMVGDNLKDILAGQNAGVKTVLVRTGYGTETEKGSFPAGAGPLYIADDLLDAVKWIMRDRRP